MSTTEQANTDPEIDATVAQLRADLSSLQKRLEYPKERMQLADWQNLLAEQQYRKHFTMKARVAAGVQAREEFRARRSRERANAEKQIAKIQAETSDRLDQHDRKRALIERDGEEKITPIRQALRAGREEEDAYVLAVEREPRTVIVPPVPPKGIDNSAMQELSERPMWLSDGTLRNPVTGKIFRRGGRRR
jgi:hypothetical protein